METVTAHRKERAADPDVDAGFNDALLRKLLTDANESPDGEAYQELLLGPGYRLAIEVIPRKHRTPGYTLVVLIDSPNRGTRGRITHGGLAKVEAALGARGYVSARLDNGWMAHERSVVRSRLPAEWRFVRRLFETQVLASEGRA